jgi:hypothetical protein
VLRWDSKREDHGKYGKFDHGKYGNFEGNNSFFL